MTTCFEPCAHALRCCSAAVVLAAFGCAHAVQPQTQLSAGIDHNGADLLAATSSPVAAADFTLLGYGSPLPLVATAYNYYVSPAGLDTASGSRTAPFRTLSRAAAVVAAKAATIRSDGARQGITVWVAPGTYSGGFKTTASGDAVPSGRIYYISTTKWGARIVPPATGGVKSAWDNRGNYVSIFGFEVDGSKLGNGAAWRYGLYSGGSHTHFHGNKVSHIATTVPCTSAGGSAIGVDSYYKGVKGEVIGNVVHDIGQAGCRFVQGIYISTSAVVKNNVVFRVAAAGIHLWHDANDVLVTNNTVSRSTHGIVVGGGDFYWRTTGADHIRVHNNVLHDNAYGVSETGKTGCNNVYSDNLAFKNTYNWSLKPCVANSSTVNADPQMGRQSRQPGLPDYGMRPGLPPFRRATANQDDLPDLEERGRSVGTGDDIGQCSPADE